MAPAKPKTKAQANGKERKIRRILRESGLFLADILYNAVIIIILVILIRTYLISPFRIIGSSMADTLRSNEFILIDKLSYHLGEPKSGDPIVFRPPITNKNPPKFEEAVTMDGAGMGILDLSPLEAVKEVVYCQNAILKPFWFCREGVNEGDLVFYRPIEEKESNPNEELNWKNAQRKTITKGEAGSKRLQIQGEPEKSYLLRIYNHSGPEYFVKRIIGIPGDTIKIENGRVYRKIPGEEAFEELKEAYLNDENKYGTFFNQKPENDTFTIPEGHYFVLGDNRKHSNDARSWLSPVTQEPAPYVSADDISGKVLVVLWPLKDIRFIPSGNL